MAQRVKDIIVLLNAALPWALPVIALAGGLRTSVVQWPYHLVTPLPRISETEMLEGTSKLPVLSPGKAKPCSLVHLLCIFLVKLGKKCQAFLGKLFSFKDRSALYPLWSQGRMADRATKKHSLPVLLGDASQIRGQETNSSRAVASL